MFDDLKAFVAVLDHGSHTGAAAALHVTQSAISRRIQHLEETVGATLFDRNSKPPMPTALGRRLYQHAVPLLRDLAWLMELSRHDAPPRGAFRFGLTQAIADATLLTLMTALKTQFPALDVSVRSDWSGVLQSALLAGTLDAATLMLPAGSRLPDGLAGQRLATLDVVVVQSRAMPLVDAVTTIAALASQEWILNPEGCGYRAALVRALAAIGTAPRLSVGANGAEMQLRMVAAGLGLGLVPRATLRKSPTASQLSIVQPADFALRLDVWLAHPAAPGNLRQPLDLLIATIANDFAA
jgi:DNA-binding transcriptional LysR family regulator